MLSEWDLKFSPLHSLYTFNTYLQAVTHIWHVLSSSPSTSSCQPTKDEHYSQRLILYKGSTSDCGDACWALECPTVWDTYTGLWTHHFYLSHKCSHFCSAFLSILTRGPSLIFLGTWKRHGRSCWDAEFTLVPETSWINAASLFFDNPVIW